MRKLVLMLLLITGLAVCANAQDTAKVKKTPEERAAQMGKMMQKRLYLTADQSTKINAILLDRAQKEEVMKGQKGSKGDRLKVMTDADTQINALLNPDQQKMYAAIKEKMKEKEGSSKGGAAMPPTTTPPPAQ